MSDRFVQLSIDERSVATVTLDRPGKYNAFDETMIAQLAGIFADLATMDRVRVVVIRGNGRHFCAGADINWMRRSADLNEADNRRDARVFAEMLHALDTLPQPTIARVHGAALGGGTGITCCCDIAIAATDSRFAFSEVRLGIIPAVIGPFAIRAIGARAARRLFLTGERFDAVRALQLGLISEAVDEAQLDTTLESILAELLNAAPGAVRAAKQLIRDVHGRPLDGKLRETTSRRIAAIRAGAEAREGLSAFLEKRPPDWK